MQGINNNVKFVHAERYCSVYQLSVREFSVFYSVLHKVFSVFRLFKSQYDSHYC
jgi:hypothetical protein